MITARQFWVREPGHGEIVTVDLPDRKEGQLFVRTLYTGISRGTESLVFRGQVPESQWKVMRSPFQEGDFPAPVKYGYMNVGIVEEGAEDFLGRTVFCLYPHQDFYCVPEAAVTLVPDEVPAERAVLAANMQTAVNAIWDAKPSVGDRIVVLGAGVVGLLIAWLCRQIPGAQVSVVDIDPTREAAAVHLGLKFLVEPPLTSLADLVIHASGRPEGLVSALSVAGQEANVVDVSWYGITTVPLPLGEAFHSRRLTLKSSQVSNLPPDQMRRWDAERRAVLAVNLLSDNALDVLLTGESTFEHLPTIMARLSESASGVLCHRIRYSRNKNNKD